jgi:hypothetical protein
VGENVLDCKAGSQEKWSSGLQEASPTDHNGDVPNGYAWWAHTPPRRWCNQIPILVIHPDWDPILVIHPDWDPILAIHPDWDQILAIHSDWDPILAIHPDRETDFSNPDFSDPDLGDELKRNLTTDIFKKEECQKMPNSNIL